jgi:hypothetical protein
MAVGPISLVTMLEYCKAYEIEGEQREDFLWMVSRLDHKYLEWGRPDGSSGVQQTDNSPSLGSRKKR